MGRKGFKGYNPRTFPCSLIAFSKTKMAKIQSGPLESWNAVKPFHGKFDILNWSLTLGYAIVILLSDPIALGLFWTSLISGKVNLFWEFEIGRYSLLCWIKLYSYF